MKITVTLKHDDIIELANRMNDDWGNDPKPSPGYLEYMMCRHLRDMGKGDFIEEMSRTIPATLDCCKKRYTCNKELFDVQKQIQRLI